MKGVIRAILKENLKCSSIGIARIFSIKALVMLVIVLSTVMPIIIISEDGRDEGGEELYKFRHPSDLPTNSWGDTSDWERIDEIPVEEKSDDDGPGDLLTVIVIAMAVLNIAICHTYVLSRNMGGGRFSILRHLGVPAGEVFRGNLVSVVIIFSFVSVLDMVFLSLLYAMASSLLPEVFIVGIVSAAVVLSLYLVGMYHPTSVRLFRRRLMVPLIVMFIFVMLGILLSRTIVDPVLDSFGLDVPVLEAILNGLSPVHFIGVVTGWVTGGQAILITDLIWTVPTVLLILAGIIFTRRIEGDELRSPILSVH